MSVYQIEIGWKLEDGGAPLYISGAVTLGKRVPHVARFRAVEQRTEDDVELPDWARDAAEEALIAEAQTMWGAK